MIVGTMSNRCKKKRSKQSIRAKKSQVSLEYLITLGLLLGMLVIGAGISVNKSTNNLKIEKSNAALEKIAHTAEKVNYLGIGSFEIIELKLVRGTNIEYEEDSLKLNYPVFRSRANTYKKTSFEIETNTLNSNLNDLGSYVRLKIEKDTNRVVLKKMD